MDSLGGVVSTLISLGFKILAGIFVLGIIGFLLFYNHKRKAYNIPVTIWIPRSDGKITDEISAKGGFFKIKQKSGGFVSSFRLKRDKQSAIDIPPPPSRYLVGLSRKLYLVQKGIDDFEPVLPDSFRYVKTEGGNKLIVTDLKCINQDATAWTEDFRENSKRRFTLHGFWEKYKDFIQMTIFIFIVMLAIYINWIGMKEVVAGLKEVAESLARTSCSGESISVK